MAQQTAVDFFFTKVLGSLHISMSKTDIDELLIESKQMEKEQINMNKEIGFVNIHIDIETKKLYISETPYKTIDEAEAGVLIGDNIEKVGIFRIQYTKHD